MRLFKTRVLYSDKSFSLVSRATNHKAKFHQLFDQLISIPNLTIYGFAVLWDSPQSSAMPKLVDTIREYGGSELKKDTL